MKISLNWLNDYIDIKKYRPEDLADIFTSLGIEVETIESFTPITGEVVVGEIVDCIPHPNADSLQICTVEVGKNAPARIVCGGANARKGLKVAAALAGAKLPGDFKIKVGKIRGEESVGMLCGETELQLGTNDDGIMELPADAKIGASIIEMYNVSDTVFELGLTPNRADCNGYIGLARDLSAKLGLPLKRPEIYQNAHTPEYKTSSVVSVAIEDDDSCGRFCALAVKGVSVLPSPMWLQRRLEMSGMRAVNLIVDATNYVMLEYGQPIHAYDSRDINGKKIIVRDAKDGEVATTLDSQKRTLQAQDIVICDDKNVIGIAGIMGGENSEVKDDTSEIVIEVAAFHPIKVRKTAKRLGIHSEASHRFERGTDIEACDVVCHRVAGLIAQLLNEVGAGAKVAVSSELIDCYPKPVDRPMIALRIDRLRQISGDINYDVKQVTEILEGLGIRLMDQKDGRLLFQVPSWRHDIVREIDLIEEVMRVHGFEKLKTSLPVMEIRPLPENPFIRLSEQMRAAAASQGFCETMSFPFTSSADLDHFQLPMQHPMRMNVKLKNAIVSEENILQPTVVMGLVKALDRNRRAGEVQVKLFECARAYFGAEARGEDGYFSILAANRAFLTPRAKADKRPIEIPVLAGVIGQPGQQKTWSGSEKSADFFSAKDTCIAILKSVGITGVELSPAPEQDLPFLHPGASAVITTGKKIIGYVGELHPKVARAYSFTMTEAPIVFELLLEPILDLIRQGYRVDTNQYKFPPTTRDLALVVPRDISFASVSQALNSFRKRNMKSYHLFDLYEGENLKAGHKSMAFSFAFQSNKKTLNDQEVDKEIELLLSHLKSEVGAELR